MALRLLPGAGSFCGCISNCRRIFFLTRLNPLSICSVKGKAERQFEMQPFLHHLFLISTYALMFKAVIESLQSLASFSEKELAFFDSKLVIQYVHKNDFVLKEGSVCQAIYFLLKGSCVHMLSSPDGTETVLNLYTRHTWLTDYQSFTSQKPALAFIRAFEDCELAVLPINAIHEIIQYSPVFFKAGRILEMMQYTDISTLHLSPEEKYQQLLINRPELLQAFPLKMLASWLRIAPETLSRIRRRIK